jgi:hypothetical protein
MKQYNCTARSVQNKHNLQQKGRIKDVKIPDIVRKTLSTPNVPDKKFADDYVSVFPTEYNWWNSFGVRRSLNQRQKRKIRRQC